tara:strand:- start:1090 stop:1794 length:705 start_codon:yes stop_codon:yes gene_type:complete
VNLHTIRIWLCAASIALLCGCGGSSDPVEKLSRELTRFPEYSIIVDDLDVVDGFFADYFLGLRIVTASGQRVAGRDTLMYSERIERFEVSEDIFARYENYLGMVVASKGRDGRETGVRQAYPQGYQYVGNPTYGFWGGGGFWQFYGQYAFMRDMMGGWRVGRDDYDNYRRYQDRGRPYYGPVSSGRPTFGTSGAQTEKTRPNFYKRYSQRVGAGRQAFSGSVRGRSGSAWGRGK